MRSVPASRCSSRGQWIAYPNGSGPIGEAHRAGLLRVIAAADGPRRAAGTVAEEASRAAAEANRAVELELGSG
jgi:hypothetical protein